jgi:N utilization substance protein A
VRLANRLVDWDIDVKTYAQFEEMDISSEPRAAASRLFGESEYEDEISTITELPGVDEAVAALLSQNDIEYIEDFINADDERLAAIEGLSNEQIDALRSLIDELVEVKVEDVDEDLAGSESENDAPDFETNAEEQEEQFEDNKEQEAGADYEPAADKPAPDEDIDEDIDDEELELVCPECGAKINTDMTSCPNCGIGLSFEYEE